MNFSVNVKHIKTRELREATKDLEVFLDIMARFMVDESGNEIPRDEAMAILDETNLEELLQAQEDFLAAFNLRKKNAIR